MTDTPEIDDDAAFRARMMDGPVDEDAALGNIRQTASGRRHALGTWHPDVLRVDAETSWLIWRDGVNWALSESAKMNPLLMMACECVVLMMQARVAAPEVCKACGAVQEP